jgi:hypothetical protein
VSTLNKRLAIVGQGSVGAVWQGFACALLPWFLIAPFLFAIARAVTQPIFAGLVAAQDVGGEGEAGEPTQAGGSDKKST